MKHQMTLNILILTIVVSKVVVHEFHRTYNVGAHISSIVCSFILS